MNEAKTYVMDALEKYKDSITIVVKIIGLPMIITFSYLPLGKYY